MKEIFTSGKTLGLLAVVFLGAGALVVTATPEIDPCGEGGNTTPIVQGPTVLGTQENLMNAGPVIGYVGSRQANVWVAPMDVSAQVYIGYQRQGYPEEWVPFPVSTNGLSSQVSLLGLEPDTSYAYRIVVNGYEAHGDGGVFRTGPEGHFIGKISITSCMDERQYPSQNGWTALAAGSPGLLIHTGDTHYANSTLQSRIRDYTMNQRRVPEYRSALRGLPTIAIWDDHDYAGNDATGDASGKEASLAAWREFWPSPVFGEAENPGVYFKTSYGDVDIFMLDTRYYRSPNSAPDDAAKIMLGEAQFEWLEREVSASTATFKLIVSGSTIFWSQTDGWSRYTADRNRLLALTKTVPGIIFVSGDIHEGVIDRREFTSATAGYPIYDIVASGMAVPTASGHRYYVDLDVDTTSVDPTLTATIHRITADGVDEPETPNLRAADLGPYQEAIEHTWTIRLSELQPVVPGIPFSLQVNNTGFTVPDAPTLDFSTNMTALAWVKFNTIGNNILLGKWRTGADMAFRLDVRSNGALRVFMNSSSNAVTSVANAVRTGEWMLLGATYDGTVSLPSERWKLYVNGQRVATTGGSSMAAAMLNTTNAFKVGDGGLGVNGNVFRPMLFHETKTADDMTRLWNNGIALSIDQLRTESGLVALWPLQEDYTDIVNGNTGARINEPRFVQALPPL